MTKYYKFPCGCRFPIVDSEGGDKPRIKYIPDINNIPLDCQRTWDLLSEGNTKGVFQLESNLGRSLSRRLKPRSIEHLSALIAIMRPGSLEAYRDGKSVTQHYIDRKNGEEEISYFHPSLEHILKPTMGEMCYQEQAMQIARDIAGFTEEDADVLRKAIGKKKPEIMAKLKEQFINGCKSKGLVTQEESETIFGWIEKSQRYSFNASHSYAYAMNSYLSAYTKAHFPRVFFTSYLYYASEKSKPFDEIRELVQNARNMDIDVIPPSICIRNAKYKLDGQNIRVGVLDLKDIGQSILTSLDKEIIYAETILQKPISEWYWGEFLLYIIPNVNSRAIKPLICSGALSTWKFDRTQMYFDYEHFITLNEREIKGIIQHYGHKIKPTDTAKNLVKILVETPVGRNTGGCSNKNRHAKVNGIYQSLQNPPFTLKDSAEWIAGVEQEYIGISLTTTSVEGCDISAANANCRDFIQGVMRPGPLIIAVKIDRVKVTQTKKGKNPGREMAFLVTSDISGTIDNVVAFPEAYAEYSHLLTEDNNVLLVGKRGDKDKQSFNLQKVWQI